MSFLSAGYLLSLFILVIIYYLTNKSRRYIVLLLFDILFFSLFSCYAWIFFLFTGVSTYLLARYLEKSKEKQNILIILTIALNLTIMLGLRLPFITDKYSFIVPIGLSFYTLQTIAYVIDVKRGEISAEKDFFKYLLFIGFFPYILQGPIPRYSEMKDELFTGHDIDTDNLKRGIYMLVYGYFLKMVIADRCAIPVDILFAGYKDYKGFYLLMAGILYSLQLYADFSGCVYIAKGSAALFGICIPDNFDQPYFATSIRDFWKRWHISLSRFLKDYVYIPLGGNRKGKIRKYVNILVTFLISGIWHGHGNHFIVWGLLHGVYQVLGDIFKPVKEKLAGLYDLKRDSFGKKVLSILFTDFLVMIAWIFFRANSIKQGIYMTVNIFTEFNPWIFFTGEMANLGLNEHEWKLLIICVVIMIAVGIMREVKGSILDRFLSQPNLFRCLCLMAIIFVILIAGIYGPGYNAKDFIYGGF